MSRGLTYMSLLASIKQAEIRADARASRVGWGSTEPTRARRWRFSFPPFRRASR